MRTAAWGPPGLERELACGHSNPRELVPAASRPGCQQTHTPRFLGGRAATS